MKKIVVIAIFTFFLFLFAQANVETVAKEVLEAYKTKNVEMLKKNASGMVAHIINENYFEDKSIKEDMKSLANWNGKIKGIRYDSENFMGNFVIIAHAYYSDHSEDEINVVTLSNMNSTRWVFLGTGLDQMKKTDFDQLSTTVPQDPKNKSKTDKSAEPKIKMDIELADGSTFNNVNEAQLLESFNSLDDDNFYIILYPSDGNDFIQAAFSEGNYIVQYNADDIQYEANDILSKETTLDIFKKYLLGEPEWREGAEWTQWE
ncbi:MAG: hypothetical protein U5N26_07075 [Candidatus Marinimicrobia bacterium]|nr:hypothetical protein [Candidatus Neomarinimicrobiota bacterium]